MSMKRANYSYTERDVPRPASSTKIFLVGTVLLALMTLVDLFK
jgi:hypothetical protein